MSCRFITSMFFVVFVFVLIFLPCYDVVLIFLFIETRGGTRKQGKDCCSVWAWRKSGIKMLVTARGLFFFFWTLFHESCHFGHILRPILGKSAQIRKKWPVFSKSGRFHGKVGRFPEKWVDFLKSDAFYKKWRGFPKIINFLENSTTFRAEIYKNIKGGTSGHFFQAEDAHPSRRGSLPFIYFRGVRSPKFGKGGVI